jgi:pimeloyl-ACP methyl ester carboxylesterase
MTRTAIVALFALIVGFAWGALFVRDSVFPRAIYTQAKERVVALLPPLEAERSSVDPSTVLRIRTAADVEIRRGELNRLVFGTAAVPHDLAPIVESVGAVPGLPSARSIQRLTARFAEGVKSTAYLLRSGGRYLVLLHGGHDQQFLPPATHAAARSFLSAGADVLLLHMPLHGWNNRPTVVLRSGDPVTLNRHDDLAHFDRPLRFFFEPVARAVNYVQRFGYSRIIMGGVSGGGWTTTVYAAMDPRITVAFAVSGSLPMYLRTRIERGDFEQGMPQLMRVANYLDLYAMAAHNRRFMQINVNRDPCCFGKGRVLNYASGVSRRFRRHRRDRLRGARDLTCHDRACDRDVQIELTMGCG